jgi:hypothetical protein
MCKRRASEVNKAYAGCCRPKSRDNVEPARGERPFRKVSATVVYRAFDNPAYFSIVRWTVEAARSLSGPTQ